MTERMENALNHIKTSVDVDPWAMEEVERVFKGIDNAIAEIEQIEVNGQINSQTCFVRTAEQVKTMVVDIIRKHTKVGDAE